jgi:hypothetical protein
MAMKMWLEIIPTSFVLTHFCRDLDNNIEAQNVIKKAYDSGHQVRGNTYKE